MKFANAKNLLVLGCGVFFAVVIVLSLGGNSGAAGVCGSGDSCSYIKTYGGDVMAGGWFNSSTGCATNYQAYTGTAATADNGGILTYAKSSGSNAAGGASSQYGAFALGSIEGASASYYGFYSDANGAGGNVAQLSFANSGLPSASGAWGGQFEDGGTGANCIPDYYAKQNSPTNEGSNLTSLALGNITSGQYSATGGSPTLQLTGNLSTTTTVNATLFIKGNVYIGSNITYPTSYLPTAVPKFALVVQGNIYIDPSVTEIDGLYIAEPTSGTTDGVIWTCHDGTDNSTSIDATTLLATGVCHKNPLNVEGALVAKQINFLRTTGDVTSAAASPSEDNLTNGLASTNISELINYTPAMVIGGPFFNVSSSTAVDSLISLPPVF